MNLKFWQSKESAPATAETKSAIPFYYVGDVQGGSMYQWMYGGYNRLTPQQAASIYRSSSSVAIAIDTIADEAERIMPVLEINGVLTDEHPVLDLLKNPNPYQTQQRFAGAMIRDYLLNHDAYAIAVGNLRTEPVGIYSIDPQIVSGAQGSNGLPMWWNVSSGAVEGNFTPELIKRRVRYSSGPIKELVQISGYRSRPHSIYADSPLEAALLEAKQQVEGRNHNLKLIQNGARLSLIAVFKHPLNETELRERRQALNEQLGGSNNAGKIAAISTDDVELNEVGTSNKDMDFAKLDQTAFTTIMMRYKVPLPLISDASQTDNNFSEAVFQLYDRAVLPAYQYVMSGLGQMLLPRYGLNPSTARITFDPESIESLRQRTIDTLIKRRTLNIETTNEMRQDLPNRNPVAGGDVIYQAATLVPLGEGMGSESDLNRAENEASRQTQADEEAARQSESETGE